MFAAFYFTVCHPPGSLPENHVSRRCSVTQISTEIKTTDDHLPFIWQCIDGIGLGHLIHRYYRVHLYLQ